MADGEDGTEDPVERAARGRPLPPEDRVWRHPAEVAMEARRIEQVRQTRRRRATASLVGGAVATAGLLWLAQAGPTDVAVRSELVSLPTLDHAAVPTSAATSPAIVAGSTQSVRPPVLSIRTDGRGTVLAGAFMIDGNHLVTSSGALADLTDVSIVWDDRTEAGVVLGDDGDTDIAVVRIESHPPPDDRPDAESIAEGDMISLAEPGAYLDTLAVVKAVSASEREDGEPIVGIVELDGTLGNVPPGSPAFDADGAVVGIITSTAEDAPAAVVPIDLVRVVAAEIIDDGVANHPRLGVRARNPVESDAVAADGSLVTSVATDSPAAIGGLVVGDLIVEIDGTAVTSMESMVATLRTHEPGDAVQVLALRNGEPFRCFVALDSHLEVAA